MSFIFNMDLDNRHKVTNFGFNIKESPPTIYFRLYENGYAFDMNKFERLTLRYRIEKSNEIITENYTTTEIVNGETLVKVVLSSQLFAPTSTIFVSPTVKISNKSIILKEFEFIIHEGNPQEMNSVKYAIRKLNDMYYQYIKAVKRDQIDKPNGVVGLDNQGKIPMNKLNLEATKHVYDRIFNTEVHGLRMNDNFEIEIFDTDENKYVLVNSIHGGNFTSSQKDSSKDVFGGTFSLNDDSTKSIFGGLFKQN